MKICTLYCHGAHSRAADISQFQELISCAFYRSDMFTQEIVFLLEGCRNDQVSITLGFLLTSPPWSPKVPRYLVPPQPFSWNALARMSPSGNINKTSQLNLNPRGKLEGEAGQWAEKQRKII